MDNKTREARRSDALYYGNARRRVLCDRVASLEMLASAMPYCWNGWCEDGCPLYDISHKECLAEGSARVLGIRTDVEPD